MRTRYYHEIWMIEDNLVVPAVKARPVRCTFMPVWIGLDFCGGNILLTETVTGDFLVI